jgi:hypothetical protein
MEQSVEMEMKSDRDYIAEMMVKVADLIDFLTEKFPEEDPGPILATALGSLAAFRHRDRLNSPEEVKALVAKFAAVAQTGALMLHELDSKNHDREARH